MSQLEETSPRVRRARPFRRPGRLWCVSLMHFISWWGLVGFIGISIAMLITGNRAWGIASLVACGVFVVSRTLAFILSRHLSCPLCMGKVMASVRCHKHVKAQCLPPLTHRATAVLAVLFTLSFRCMYCGTRFRLRK